jgi:predicted ATP-dependent serine protease
VASDHSVCDPKYLEAYLNPQHFFADTSQPAGHRAWCATWVALHDWTNNETPEIKFDDNLNDTLQRWPSGLEYIDYHCGGFYGLAVILGGQKTGKTMLALGSCIEAAATEEWQVVYLCAELDQHEMALRLNRYFKAQPASRACQDFLHIIFIGKGQTPAMIQAQVELATDPGGPPILICMDSINTITEMSGMDYLRTLRDYALWAMLSRRMSNGAVSFLIVSETNKIGSSKGGKLEFWADQVVKIENPKKRQVLGLVPVKMTLMASRRTGGEGDMGVYLRNQNTCRFQAEAKAPRLTKAGGMDWHEL